MKRVSKFVILFDMNACALSNIRRDLNEMKKR